MSNMGDMVTFRRYIHLDSSPQGELVPIFCSEYVSDGRYQFYTDTSMKPPTNEEMFSRYPLDFIGYIGAWVSSFTKKLWKKRQATEGS